MSSKFSYFPSIGLEIHAQLLTERKMFSPEATSYGALPNRCTTPITLGHPGTLPMAPNKRAIASGIKVGLAFNSAITRHNRFARKNYFYPDLAKGYQITQDKTPLCTGGYVTIRMPEERRVRIRRVHIEEDTAKSLHNMMPGKTLLDFNRAGSPLIEIVTEPDMHTPEEAYECVMEIRRLVRYLGVCDGHMEEGSLRCDVNVSVCRQGVESLGSKVEVKNLNSMRHVRLATTYEIARQVATLEGGEAIIQSTRSYDARRDVTVHQRNKEMLSEYRYFPDPDLSPVVVDEAWIEAIKADMPVLPSELMKRFMGVYGLTDYDAGVLVGDKGIALFFEELCQHTSHYKAAANWVMGPVKSYLNQEKVMVDAFPVGVVSLARVIGMVEEGLLSFSVATSRLLPMLVASPASDAYELAEGAGLLQRVHANELEGWVEGVLARYPDKVVAYKKGKRGLLGFFMGEVMRLSGGKANPREAMAILQKHMSL